MLKNTKAKALRLADALAKRTETKVMKLESKILYECKIIRLDFSNRELIFLRKKSINIYLMSKIDI